MPKDSKRTPVKVKKKKKTVKGKTSKSGTVKRGKSTLVAGSIAAVKG